MNAYATAHWSDPALHGAATAAEALLRALRPELAELLPAGAALVDFGAEHGAGARALLPALRSPRAYAPIGVNEMALLALCEVVEEMHPELLLAPMLAPAEAALRLPAALAGLPRVGLVVDSAAGSAQLLRHARETLGGGAHASWLLLARAEQLGRHDAAVLNAIAKAGGWTRWRRLIADAGPMSLHLMTTRGV